MNVIRRIFGILLMVVSVINLSYGDFQRISRYEIDRCDTEPWERRIYSYDFDIASDETIHVVYAKPNEPDYSSDSVIYAYGSATNMTKVVLETNGTHQSISTFIVVDRDHGDKVHICYNRGQAGGKEYFIYQTVESGSPSSQIVVDPHAWHSRMQVNEEGLPIFVRQGDYGLRLFVPTGEWAWSEQYVGTGSITATRIGDFVYDKKRHIYHIIFGDTACSETFRARPFHRLWYCKASENLNDWSNELVNSTCKLWEDEFWVSMVLSQSGDPRIAMYEFNNYNGQYNTGTSLFYTEKSNETWNEQIIAGVISGGEYPDHRAGMGVQMASKGDHVFAVFDDSPDYPIDFSGEYGNIVLRYTKNGTDWKELQQIEEFSAEGYCRTKVLKDKLYIMVMGDWHDTRLYFYSYLLSDTNILAQSLPVVGDFDGDGKAGYGIYYPPTGLWHIDMTTNGVWENNFGYDGTEPITGDFDGDGKLDFGCYYPPTGWWYIYKSSGGFWSTKFGYKGTIPFTGDFNGDNAVDFGCYFPPDGWWYIYESGSGTRVEKFGYSDTEPICGYFDDDTQEDYGCYHAPDGWWYIHQSGGGYWTVNFGYLGTIPFTGDFDGDGKGDFGCYYPRDGWWYFYKSTTGLFVTQFGFAGTLPVTADFDGDGKTDYGCFDPKTGNWYLQCSTLGFSLEQSVVY